MTYLVHIDLDYNPYNRYDELMDFCSSRFKLNEEYDSYMEDPSSGRNILTIRFKNQEDLVEFKLRCL